MKVKKMCILLLLLIFASSITVLANIASPYEPTEIEDNSLTKDKILPKDKISNDLALFYKYYSFVASKSESKKITLTGEFNPGSTIYVFDKNDNAISCGAIIEKSCEIFFTSKKGEQYIIEVKEPNLQIAHDFTMKIAVHSHSFEEKGVKKASTKSDGYHLSVCKDCNKRKTTRIPQIKEEKIICKNCIYNGKKQMASLTLIDANGKNIPIDDKYITHSEDLINCGTKFYKVDLTTHPEYGGVWNMEYNILKAQNKITNISDISLYAKEKSQKKLLKPTVIEGKIKYKVLDESKTPWLKVASDGTISIAKYPLSLSENKAQGKIRITVTDKNYETLSKDIVITVKKASQKISSKSITYTCNYNTVRKGNYSKKLELTSKTKKYTIVSGTNAKIKLKSDGTMTIAKDISKGTYTIKVKALGNKLYLPSKQLKLTIKVQ